MRGRHLASMGGVWSIRYKVTDTTDQVRVRDTNETAIRAVSGTGWKPTKWLATWASPTSRAPPRSSAPGRSGAMSAHGHDETLAVVALTRSIRDAEMKTLPERRTTGR